VARTAAGRTRRSNLTPSDTFYFFPHSGLENCRAGHAQQRLTPRNSIFFYSLSPLEALKFFPALFGSDPFKLRAALSGGVGPLERGDRRLRGGGFCGRCGRARRPPARYATLPPNNGQGSCDGQGPNSGRTLT